MNRNHFAIVALAVIAAPVESRSFEQVQTQVRYADLDLGTETGVARLRERVRRAATDLCRRERHYNLAAAALPEPQCLREALAVGEALLARAIASRMHGQLGAGPAERH